MVDTAAVIDISGAPASLRSGSVRIEASTLVDRAKETRFRSVFASGTASLRGGDAWGGALEPNVLGAAEIGPGYDHSAVPGRALPPHERSGAARPRGDDGRRRGRAGDGPGGCLARLDPDDQ